MRRPKNRSSRSVRYYERDNDCLEIRSRGSSWTDVHPIVACRWHSVIGGIRVSTGRHYTTAHVVAARIGGQSTRIITGRRIVV